MLRRRKLSRETVGEPEIEELPRVRPVEFRTLEEKGRLRKLCLR